MYFDNRGRISELTLTLGNPELNTLILLSFPKEIILEYLNDTFSQLNLDEENRNFCNSFISFVEHEYLVAASSISNIITEIVIGKFIHYLPTVKILFQLVNEDWYKLLYLIKMIQAGYLDKFTSVNIQEEVKELIEEYDKMITFYDNL